MAAATELHIEPHLDAPCYRDLWPWAAQLCEDAYRQSRERGRRRRSSREDFAPGWKEACRQLGRQDVFRPGMA